MMNLFQLQEQLKDFSKDQLVREMQSPSGSAPPFLVMTELQRRSRMENAAALDKGPPTTTVAQDAVNAAGVPQGGLADMARSMAPQTDMTQNTGAMTPQAGVVPQGSTAAPAPVQAMQEGGLAGISRNLRDYGVEQDPMVSMMAGRAGMTPSDYIAALDPEARAAHARRIARARMMALEPQAGDDIPTQEDLDLRYAEQPLTDEMLTERAISQGGANPSYVESMQLPTLYEEPFVNATMSRGVTAPTAPDEIAPYIAPMSAPGTAEDYQETFAAAREGRRARPTPRMRDTPSLSDLIDAQTAMPDLGIGPDFMSVGPDRSVQEGLPATSGSDLSLPDRLLMGQRGGGASDMNFYSPETPALGDVIDVRDNVPATGRGVSTPTPMAPEPPDFYSQLAADMAMDRRMGGDVPATGRGVSTPTPMAPEPPDLYAQLAADMAMDRRMGGDAAATAGRGVSTPTPMAPEPPDFYSQLAADMAMDRRMGGDAAATRSPLVEAPRTGGSVLDTIRDTATVLSPFASEEEKQGASENLGAEPPVVPEEVAPEEVAPVLTPNAPSAAPTGPAGQPSGGAGGLGGMPAMAPQSAEDRMLQQDKWLALARFGAALASSQAPTFGQALGQAGQVGLDALSQARSDFLERKEAADKMAMARAALAARGAGGEPASPKLPIGAVKLFDDEIARLEAAIPMAANRAQELELQKALDRAVANRNAAAAIYLSPYSPGLAAAALGPGAEQPPAVDVSGSNEVSTWDRLRGMIGSSE